MACVRVIGAGWGRTGTTSLAAALERLGAGPCLQMQELWTHVDLAQAWNRHHRGEPTDWPSVLAGWTSTVDWPGCWQWREFAELWPEATVILSVRDPDAWYDSILGSIHAWTAPGKDLGHPAVAEVLTRVWDADFGGWTRVFDRAHTIGCFERHNQSVRELCPPGRLLEWKAEDGWAPLCDALGVEPPRDEFPQLNAR
jgi:Sulfotransferase domain